MVPLGGGVGLELCGEEQVAGGAGLSDGRGDVPQEPAGNKDTKVKPLEYNEFV